MVFRLCATRQSRTDVARSADGKRGLCLAAVVLLICKYEIFLWFEIPPDWPLATNLAVGN